MKLRQLFEGGWVNTITQGVKLTPALAKKAVELLPKFEAAFNEYLKKHGLPPVTIGAPVGSSAYIERDLNNNPDKEYGDIDVLLKLPRLDNTSDARLQATYKQALADFTHDAPAFVYKQEKPSGSNVILKVGDDWVQVDLVATPIDLADWTQHRMTPEHNVKGALIGFLYASLAEVLHLSIGTSGVQAKERGGVLVPFRQLKVDKTHTISTDIENFAQHILEFFAGTKSPQLRQPGMVKGDIKLERLAAIVRELAQALETSGQLGHGSLEHIKDADDLLGQVRSAYKAKADKAVQNTKFDKAATPAAKKKAQDTKDLITTQAQKILQRL